MKLFYWSIFVPFVNGNIIRSVNDRLIEQNYDTLNVNNNFVGDRCACVAFTCTKPHITGKPIRDIPPVTDLVESCEAACNSDNDCLHFKFLPSSDKYGQAACVLTLSSVVPEHQNRTGEVTTKKLCAGIYPGELLAEPFDCDCRPAKPPQNAPVNNCRLFEEDGPFPYQPELLRLPAFLQCIYVGEAGFLRFLPRELTTAAYPNVGNEIGAPTMKSAPSGAVKLTFTQAPRWAGNEIIYRISEVLQTMMEVTTYQDDFPHQPDNPINAYLSAAIDQAEGDGTLSMAMFPTDVRTLLRDNEYKIQNHQGSTWLGHNVVLSSSSRYAAPMHNIQVGYDDRYTFFQRGNAGPFSLEAAFLLAAQVAGVNWNRVEVMQRDRIWYAGVIQPTYDSNTGEALNLWAYGDLGYLQRMRRSTEDDPDGGVYIALDLDPELPEEDPKHNLFLFVVHSIDRSSIVNVPRLTDLLSATMFRYDPAPDMATARYHLSKDEKHRVTNNQPGTSDNPYPKKFSTHAFAHAHSAMINYNQFMIWARQGSKQNPSNFPIYTQFGFQHLYIITEDSDQLFPRKKYLT